MALYDEPESELRAMRDPYVLNPPNSQRGPDGTDPVGVRYNKVLGRWTQSGMFNAVDNRTVRRSNALLNYAYGAHAYSWSPLHAHMPGLLMLPR